MAVSIREAVDKDFDAIWGIFEPIVRRGDTYTYDVNTSREQAQQLWLELPKRTYVCELDGQIAGTYYIKTNQAGGGAHVCNCGYMVAASARGQGLATAMCEHSQQQARKLGYQAMQFNFVVETNTGAIELWKKLGFREVGRLPGAFKHPTHGTVDALVMFKSLARAELDGT